MQKFSEIYKEREKRRRKSSPQKIIKNKIQIQSNKILQVYWFAKVSTYFNDLQFFKNQDRFSKILYTCEDEL